MSSWFFMVYLIVFFLLSISRVCFFGIGKIWLYWQVFIETLNKKGIGQVILEVVLILVGILSLLLTNFSLLLKIILALILVVFYLSLLLVEKFREIKILNQNFVRFSDKIGSINAPNPHPRFLAILRGPFVKIENNLYDLGNLPLKNNGVMLNMVILNPSEIPPREEYLNLNVEYPEEYLEISIPNKVKAPLPGNYAELTVNVTPQKNTTTPLKVKISIEYDSYKIDKLIKIRSIFSMAEESIKIAEIKGWKYGAYAALAWRGDMDLHDPSTFQDAYGLEKVLELSRRFRVPSTLYISGRLSFNQDELREFGAFLNHNYYPERIPQFVEFLKSNVYLTPFSEFPYETPSDKRYVLEIGNHMYLHYGTYASMCKDNNWTSHAMPGQFVYSWQTTKPFNSLNQQFDNIRKNQELISSTLGIKPLTWGVPGRTNDKYTAEAVLKAGIKVGSDAYGTAKDNVLKLDVPEHPPGYEELIEVHKVYPGDPRTIRHLRMLKYWLNYAIKHRKGFVFMAHHHLRLYEGNICYKLTEEFFRYVLENLDSKIWITTVSELAFYWEDVLCNKHKKIKIAFDNKENEIYITNESVRDYEALPLEIELESGKKFVKLVDVKAEETFKIKLK